MLSVPLLELRRLLNLRLLQYRDTVGFNIAAIRMLSKLVVERRSGVILDDSNKTKDIWNGLGLGSDVAATLTKKSKKLSKK
jgi:hypothetical protein